MWKVWRQVLDHRLFTKYLLVTNIAISGGIGSLGDQIEQKLEEQENVSWARTGRMSIIGSIMAIPDHFWYQFIDKRFPQRQLRVVAKKAVLDTLVMGPPHIIIFYLGMCLMEGKTWKQSVTELKEKFLLTFMLACAFWPAVQLVNFYYLPTTLRVLYASVADLGWAVIFSRLKHTIVFNCRTTNDSSNKTAADKQN